MKKETLDFDKLKAVGKLSDEELAKLKARHKKVYTLRILFLDENDELIILYGYLKKPERYVVGMALAKLDSDPVTAKEIILFKSWIAGDERIKTDDDAFYASMQSLDEFFKARLSDIKKFY